MVRRIGTLGVFTFALLPSIGSEPVLRAQTPGSITWTETRLTDDQADQFPGGGRGISGDRDGDGLCDGQDDQPDVP